VKLLLNRKPALKVSKLQFLAPTSTQRMTTHSQSLGQASVSQAYEESN